MIIIMITNEDDVAVIFFSLLSVHIAALHGRGKFFIGERVRNDYTVS